MANNRLICLFFSAIALQAAANKLTYEGYKVFRVLPEEESQVTVLHGLQEIGEKLNFWSEPKSVNTSVDIMVHPQEIDQFVSLMRESRMSHSLLVDDVQQLIEEEKSDDEHYHTRSTKAMSWNKYYTASEINQFLDNLALAHPDIAKVITIGKSYEQRPLKVIKIGSVKATKKPTIWIDAGIHAREWVAPATATYLINQLVKNFAANRDLVDNVDWYILPVVNPDGYEYSHTHDRMWRKTRSRNAHGCRGTDANRNFGFHWNKGGSSSNGCTDTFHGPKAFSEPETKAIADFISQNKDDIKLYLSFHAYGQMWLTPWGYTSALPSDYSDLTSLAKKATSALTAVSGTRYKIGTSTNVLYVATGGSDDWAKGSAGIKYAYTVELRDTGRYGFLLPPSQILPTVQETWEAIKIIGKELPSLR